MSSVRARAKASVPSSGDVVSIRPISNSTQGGSDGSNSGRLFKAIDIGDLYNEAREEKPWVLPGYLMEGRLTLLAGPPKLGKTTLAYDAIVSVAAGGSFLGRAVDQRPVLLLGLEEHRQDIAARLVECSPKDLTGCVKVIFGPLVYTEELLKSLASYIQQAGIRLVVVDTLHAWWDLSDEKDATEVLKKGMPLLDTIRCSGAAWLGLVHTRKGGGTNGEEVRGSSALVGLADITISMKRTESGDRKRCLETITRYQETPRNVTIELTEVGYKALGTPEEVSMQARAERVWQVLTDSYKSTKELCDALQLSKQDLSRAISLLGPKVERQGKGHRGDPYRYRQNSDRPSNTCDIGTSDESNQDNRPAA